MSDPPRRVLIFGGTFDPPHRAHVALPTMVAQMLDCDRIIYVPNASNPLKDVAPTPAEHRLAMLRLALADAPHTEISTVEIERAGPSFMVDTLDQLRTELGADAELFLLIGADSALGFHCWHEWRRILDLARPAVMLRPPWTERAFDLMIHRVRPADEADFWMTCTIPVPLMDVSATDIRHHLATTAGPPANLDPRVYGYIVEHGLYGAVDVGSGSGEGTTEGTE